MYRWFVRSGTKSQFGSKEKKFLMSHQNYTQHEIVKMQDEKVNLKKRATLLVLLWCLYFFTFFSLDSSPLYKRVRGLKKKRASPFCPGIINAKGDIKKKDIKKEYKQTLWFSLDFSFLFFYFLLCLLCVGTFTHMYITRMQSVCWLYAYPPSLT